MNLTLENVGLELPEFELSIHQEFQCGRVGIFGPSGSGKTTLLEIICGLRKPSTGRVLLGPTVLSQSSNHLHLPPHQRRIGYVPQDLALFPHLSVRQNILYGHKPESTSGFRVEAVISVFEIESLLDRNVGELSGGERQRVALARTLLAAPVLLLLDEPLSSLDQRLKGRIIECLQRAQKEFSLPTICVTHDPAEAQALCDRIYMMERGRLRSAQSD
jgi:molybdate transport system ATP-binding protein